MAFSLVGVGTTANDGTGNPLRTAFQTINTLITAVNSELPLGAGSASAPALTRDGDLNTGLFFPDTDAIAFTTGSAERIRVNSSGYVGIGTTNPDARLHANSDGTTAYSTSLPTTGGQPDGTEVAVFENGDSSSANLKYSMCGIQIGSGPGQSIIYGRFGLVRTGPTSGKYVWQLRGVVDSNNTSEAMCLTSTSRLGINKASPNHTLDVGGAIGFAPGASVTPVNNGDVVFEATNNTTFTVKLKGTDGTVRSGTITLS